MTLCFRMLFSDTIHHSITGSVYFWQILSNLCFTFSRKLSFIKLLWGPLSSKEWFLTGGCMSGSPWPALASKPLNLFLTKITSIMYLGSTNKCKNFFPTFKKPTLWRPKHPANEFLNYLNTAHTISINIM